MIWIGIMTAIFFLDLFIKQMVEKKMKTGVRRKLGDRGFFLQKLHNKGFALNRMDKHPDRVKWIQSGLMVFFSIYGIAKVFFHSERKVTALGMSLILGGGFSNLYDRWKRGYVVDYLGLPGIKKIVFNLSDLCIFAGAFFVFLGDLRNRFH
ncbi:MAG: signal peptidase II [Lachnospiraceae bacterium]|nr:signal peptidase II [Lachnospiraceae bacterium]